MRNYDYLHEGLSDGMSAAPGRIFTVLRTNQKLNGLVTNWKATKSTMKTTIGMRRMFVNEDGSTAWFGGEDVLRGG